jgi:tRNA(fMet)-specific endonuclease VapC
MLYILDTDIFSLYLQGNLNVFDAVIRHAATDLAVSIITVGELWSGWWTPIHRAKTEDQTAEAYRRLTETLNELRNWNVITFHKPALQTYTVLKQRKLNVGGNDLRIAAIALELSATVVTRNVTDFGRVANLTIEDWSK